MPLYCVSTIYGFHLCLFTCAHIVPETENSLHVLALPNMKYSVMWSHSFSKWDKVYLELYMTKFAIKCCKFITNEINFETMIHLKGIRLRQPHPPIFVQKNKDLYTIRSVYLCSDCILSLTCKFNSVTKIYKFFFQLLYWNNERSTW